MVDSVEVWLPKLSDRLHYIQETYPVIMHRVPTEEFALLADEDGEDLTALIVEHNADIIVRPEALKQAEFLAPGHGRAPHSASMPTSIVLHFTDPVVANKSIDQHIALWGGLSPTAKFIPRPPICFNCQHTGHFTRSCRSLTRCGLCTENHDMRLCWATRKSTPPDQLPFFKCARCQGPHATADSGCPVRSAATHAHWHRITDVGPHFLGLVSVFPKALTCHSSLTLFSPTCAWLQHDEVCITTLCTISACTRRVLGAPAHSYGLGQCSGGIPLASLFPSCAHLSFEMARH